MRRHAIDPAAANSDPLEMSPNPLGTNASPVTGWLPVSISGVAPVAVECDHPDLAIIAARIQARVVVDADRDRTQARARHVQRTSDTEPSGATRS
jgi:hypothetical protein